MNNWNTSRDFPFAKCIRKLGVPQRTLNYFFNAIEKQNIPNIQKLLKTFRKYEMRVIYSTAGCELPDCSDLPPTFRAVAKFIGMDKCVVGSREIQIRTEIKPKRGELVIVKPGTNAFQTNSKNLATTLRWMGIELLVIVGVATDGCVYNTAVGAVDKGFFSILVNDACATFSQEQHDLFLGWAPLYFRVKNTAEIIKEIKQAEE